MTDVTNSSITVSWTLDDAVNNYVTLVRETGSENWIEPATEESAVNDRLDSMILLFKCITVQLNETVLRHA